MTQDKNALPAPDGVIGAPDDGRTAEILRVWLRDGQPQVVVRPAVQDLRMMGMILAEVSWHVAGGYARHSGVDLGEALKQLREGWLQGHANGDAANPGVVK